MEKKFRFFVGSSRAELAWPGLFLFGVLINRYGFGIPDTEALPRVMELVREGANVNARDHIRMTPAMRCCEGSGHHVILYFLIDSGADLEATSIFSETALHVATASNDYKCVILLLKQGVSVDRVSRSGETALWSACYRGYLTISSLLLEHGANPNIKHNSKMPRYSSFTGFTPRDAAIWRGHDVVARYMDTETRNYNWRRRYFYARLIQSVKGAPTDNAAIRMLQCDDLARAIGSYL